MKCERCEHGKSLGSLEWISGSLINIGALVVSYIVLVAIENAWLHTTQWSPIDHCVILVLLGGWELILLGAAIGSHMEQT